MSAAIETLAEALWADWWKSQGNRGAWADQAETTKDGWRQRAAEKERVVDARQAAIEAMAEAIKNRTGFFHARDVAGLALDALLAPRRVTCETCGGTGAGGEGDRCWTCEDGTVPADPYLVWADEYAPAAGEWIWVTSSDGDVQLRRVHSQEADLFVRRPKEPR